MDDAIASAGGVSRLGEILGVAHTSVLKWRKSGRVPAERALAIEMATGVTRHRLRPDLYGEPARTGFAKAQALFSAEAQSLGLDATAIAAKAVQEAISAEKSRRWLEENREAIDEWNRWTETNELPLAEYRMF